MKIHDWNPDDGDALQGDVCLFRVPDHIEIDTSDEIAASYGRPAKQYREAVRT